jgi:hypothetical protein
LIVVYSADRKSKKSSGMSENIKHRQPVPKKKEYIFFVRQIHHHIHGWVVSALKFPERQLGRVDRGSSPVMCAKNHLGLVLPWGFFTHHCLSALVSTKFWLFFLPLFDSAEVDYCAIRRFCSACLASAPSGAGTL